MGLLDSLSSFFVSDAYAEEQPAEEEGEQDEGGEKQEEGEEEGGDDAGGDDEEEEEEEEEEDEEPEDPMPAIQEECAKTTACTHAKEEYEECSARVTRWSEADEEERKSLGPKEDCVEEFFEYTHCISQCAAPKLFKQLR